MLFVCHDHELECLRNFQKLMARVADFRRLSDFELVCFKRPYDRTYVLLVAFDQWQELDFKGCLRRGSQHLSFLGWHHLEVFALPQRDRDDFHVSVSECWRSYEMQKAIGAVNPIALSYLLDLYCRGSELQRLIGTRIAEEEFSISSLGGFLRAARIKVVERLSFGQTMTSCKSSGAILRVPSL